MMCCAQMPVLVCQHASACWKACTAASVALGCGPAASKVQPSAAGAAAQHTSKTVHGGACKGAMHYVYADSLTYVLKTATILLEQR